MKSMIALSLSLLLLSLGACAGSEEAPAAATAPTTASASNVTPPEGPVPGHYVDAAEALAANDYDRAKTALSSLASETTGDLQSTAQVAADASDLTTMREAFKPVSELASKMDLPADYAVAMCPMYKGGAPWVQKKGDLANPYYGKGSAMESCGAFVN